MRDGWQGNPADSSHPWQHHVEPLFWCQWRPRCRCAPSRIPTSWAVPATGNKAVKMDMLPEPMTPIAFPRTIGGNKAFHNFGWCSPFPPETK